MKILPPIFKNCTEISDTRILYSACEKEERIENLVINSADLSGAALPRAEFSCVKFSGCRFGEANFKGNDFCDILFESCDFSNADFSNSSFRRTIWRDCKGVGADFSECSFRDTVFDSDILYTQTSTVQSCDLFPLKAVIFPARILRNAS